MVSTITSCLCTVIEHIVNLGSWHRRDDGTLSPGKLVKVPCQARFFNFTPNDLDTYPNVVITTDSPHSHPPPRQSSTPPIISDIFKSLLLNMKWRLADISPGRLLYEESFLGGLRRVLDWERTNDPTGSPSLIDLHPSLSNIDAVARIIDEMRKTHFPEGTGWEGTT